MNNEALLGHVYVHTNHTFLQDYKNSINIPVLIWLHLEVSSKHYLDSAVLLFVYLLYRMNYSFTSSFLFYFFQAKLYFYFHFIYYDLYLKLNFLWNSFLILKNLIILNYFINWHWLDKEEANQIWISTFYYSNFSFHFNSFDCYNNFSFDLYNYYFTNLYAKLIALMQVFDFWIYY